jgi:N-acetylneuraminate synthase
MALQMVDVAAGAGADAVKFQTFKTEKLLLPGTPKAEYQQHTTGACESQFEMIKRLELPFDVFRIIHSYCREKKIIFLSTPFDEESADFLDGLGMTAFKVPSGEITNLPLLAHIAGKIKPVILSTGMATLEEVKAAVKVIKGTGNRSLALLHCVSNYPASPAETNLRAMLTMAEEFNLPVGFSDHTPGIEVSLAAVALGACIIEKHFTLDRNLPGPDHQASLIPAELAALVRGIRNVEASLGHGRKEPAKSEAGTAAVIRKSLIAAKDIPAGTVLQEDLIAVRRPGTGLPPSMKSFLINRTARFHIPAGSLLTLEMFT